MQQNDRPTYYLWTIGCQMNQADSLRVAAALERLGYAPAEQADNADVAVVNTCVIRQQAEDKVYGRLGSLRTVKERRPGTVIALMGCLVGHRPNPELRRQFPYVDVFLPPSDPEPLLSHLLARRNGADRAAQLAALLDDDLPVPVSQQSDAVTAFVPVVLGCSHCCSFCIIPSRRGAEHSRPRAQVIAEVERLLGTGIREITLLGQIVDRYGLDLEGGVTLASLLRELHELPGLARLRFLTSHPGWCTDELLRAMAELDKVCPVLELPVQAGNNEVLERMRRGYTVERFREIIARARELMPGLAVHTDIIVGFCGETAAQFEDTRRLMAEVRFDKVHIAKYSPRPGTLAAKRYADDVPEAEKERRRQVLDDLQREVLDARQSALVGAELEVLVEARDRDRWRGRTPHNKLVYFPAEGDLLGAVVPVRIEWAGPYSLVGRCAVGAAPAGEPSSRPLLNSDPVETSTC